MSKQMKAFTDYFMKGLALGGQWANQWEERAIAQKRNEMLAAQHVETMKDKRERTSLYGESVRANAELARAKAQAALRPKGGGKAAGPGLDTAGLDQLDAEAAQRGLTVPKAAAPATTNITNVVQGSSDDGGGVGGGVQEIPVDAKGGMVRKMAGGGTIEEGAGMSIQEALHYGEKGGDRSKEPSAAAKFGSGLAGAVSKYTPKDKVEPTMPKPEGSGETYRRGGRVRNFQSGGRVVEQAIDTGTSGPGSGYGYRAAPPANARRY